jgi:hypothetical protein
MAKYMTVWCFNETPHLPHDWYDTFDKRWYSCPGMKK